MQRSKALAPLPYDLYSIPATRAVTLKGSVTPDSVPSSELCAYGMYMVHRLQADRIS